MRNINRLNPLKYANISFIFFIVFFLIIITVFFFILGFDTVEVTGEIKPKEYQAVKPKLTGFVKKLYFKDGDLVKQGDLILEMSDEELSYKLKYLEIKREELNGQIKYLSDKLAIYEKKLLLDTVKLEKDLTSLKVQWQNQSISKRDYENSLYKKETDELTGKENQITLMNDLFILENNLKNTELESEEVKSKINKCKIYAETSGIIIDEDDLIKKGLLYKDEDTILKIYSDTDIYAEVYIPETKITKIELNQKVKLYVKAVPYTKFKVFNGKLVALTKTAVKTEDKLASDKSYYRGKVIIDDPYFKFKDFKQVNMKRLLFGMTLKAKIRVGRINLIKKLIGIDF